MLIHRVHDSFLISLGHLQKPIHTSLYNFRPFHVHFPRIPFNPLVHVHCLLECVLSQSPTILVDVSPPSFSSSLFLFYYDYSLFLPLPAHALTTYLINAL